MGTDQTNYKSAEDQYVKAMAFCAKLIEYADDVDAILRDVAKHYDADRSYVFELAKNGKTLDNTYEWVKPGVTPEIDNLQKISYESVSVWFEEFEKVGAFFISSLDKDVEASSLTYEILEPQGIESLITAPIYKNKKIIGFIGVDNPKANTEDIVILKTTASILYSEISRKIAKKNQRIEEMAKTQLMQDEKLGEIRDIIASADMGIWRIELVEKEEPRMFVDDTMKKLLGISEEEATPEQTYTDWYSNITPEAVESVLKSVGRMQQGYFDENTYLWKHPSKGIRYVRCGGTAKKIPGGYSLQGYHYDVDEVVRKDLEQTNNLNLALDEKNEYYSTLGSLSEIFFSMHVIDLLEDTAIEFTASKAIRAIADHEHGAETMMKQVMRATVDGNYLDSALEFTDLSTLSARMKKKKIITRELVGKHTGWFLASFITMETDIESKPTKVIFATRIIDEEVKQKEKLIRKTQTDEMTGLLNRRAYEENIYKHNDLPEEDKFIYVSLDANGLKLINDSIGHTAGDEMLIGVSSCMKKVLGPHGHLYRIGGDEFVAILFCDEEEIRTVLAEFDKEVAGWKGKLVDSISVSYGWIDKYENPGASTRQLGAIAEKRMYEAKSAHYRRMGVDRRGQQDAHKALCALYTKILGINLTDDTFQIINMDVNEQSKDKGFKDKISDWLCEFGKSGRVHPDDLTEYLEKTDLNYMREYFKSKKSSLHIFYRRKYEDGFKQVMMEIIPADDYSDDYQSMFLYVKDIDR